MNKRILGGLAAAAMLAGGLAFMSAGTASAAEGDEPPAKPEGVCPDCDSNHQTANNQTQFTYTAPEGKFIVALCVKAGSINAGDGPEDVPGAVGLTSFTFGHSSGKQISHYSVDLDDVPKPAAVVNKVHNCAAPGIVTVTTTPYVWSFAHVAWVLGVPVQSTEDASGAQTASCPTPPPPATPVTPTPAAPTPEPAVAVAALPPTQVAPAQAPAPAGGLPATGIDGTGVTALIALLLTSLGGAALFASRRRNVTI